MASLSRQLVFLVLQYLDEEKYKETMHKLEKESGIFINMKYIEDAVTNGEWEDLDNYMAGFTKVDTNPYSRHIFFEIRKQKFLEALDKCDDSKAVNILREELKPFFSPDDPLLKELSMLFTLQNFRENVKLSKYTDTKSGRATLFVTLKKLIQSNPLFRDKLHFPVFSTSRLRMMVNQSLNWQHYKCQNRNQYPVIRTLLVDHTCEPANSGQVPSSVTNPVIGSMHNYGQFRLMRGPAPFQHAPASLTNLPPGWIPSSVPHRAISIVPMGLSPPNPSDSYVSKRPRPLGIPNEAKNLPIPILPAANPGQSHAHALQVAADDLPKIVMANLNLVSLVQTMDFHPVQQTILLVGTDIGTISIWEVSGGNMLAIRKFEVWDLEACTMTFQASLANEYSASVNRVKWSPCGNLLGVAYSKHIVHLFSYFGDGDLRNQREIDSHVGSVNDLAFSQLDKQLCVITCGDDKTIKVWDASTGTAQFVFEEHKAAVYSVCPHSKENIQFIFSTAVDGTIKAWRYDDTGSIMNYDAPFPSCITMAYCANGSRLFSCGSSKEGESFIVEMDDEEGSIKRTYRDVSKCSVGVLQFDTTKNCFLAAGDDFMIKVWDMDNENLLMVINADGGLQVSPCIRFNKEGSLLAVSTGNNGVKILANTDGVRLMRSMGTRSGVKPKATPIFSPFGTSSAVGTGASADWSSPMGVGIEFNGATRNLLDAKSRCSSGSDQSKIWKLTEINAPSQVRSLRLPDSLLPVMINRLIYTNSGDAILALANNGTHTLWKWEQTERNSSGKATCAVPPQVWLPSSGILMTNDLSETNQKEAVPCFALSKNDAYVMSASGGKISLFDILTFKTMTSFMPPPPAATCLAFHSQDNDVIAVGMEDATIKIYNVELHEVETTLKCHQKRVTGLAFSNVLDVLVSSGADAQICVWSLDGWEKKGSKFLQIPSICAPHPEAHTRLQFHKDQTHLLVVHKTQIAVYEASKLDCVQQLVSVASTVTDATYSCDCLSIYTSFNDGSVCVYTSAGLKLRCRVNNKAYLPSNNPSSSNVYPLVITAHPSEPNQFAVALTDSSVHVLEPSETLGKWGTDFPPETGLGLSLSRSGLV